MRKSEAYRLLSDYNAYRGLTQQFAQLRAKGMFPQPLKATDERLRLLEELIVWCAARNYDARLWVFILFRSRQWRWQPKFERGSLLSEGMRKRYAEAIEHSVLDAYRSRLRAEVTPSDKDYDPNRDLNSTVEARKQRYLAAGDHARCMRETVDTTLGYHPKSGVCVGCALRDECANRLRAYVDFDIQALRRGEISAQQARAEAANAAAK